MMVRVFLVAIGIVGGVLLAASLFLPLPPVSQAFDAYGDRDVRGGRWLLSVGGDGSSFCKTDGIPFEELAQCHCGADAVIRC